MGFPGFKLDVGSIRKSPAPEATEVYDILILGGGPASMCAAIYAARKVLNIAVITRDFGGQMLETSMVENWLGFQAIEAKDLLSRFEEHVKSYQIPVSMGPAITRVHKEDDEFKVELEDGKVFSGRACVFALGKRHRNLGIPGEKELTGRGVAYCATCDAPFFKKKKVVIAGGGNSAFTTAIDLIKVDAEITMVNFVKGWQADNALQSRVTGYEKIRMLDYHEIVSIQGKDRVESVTVKDRQTGEQEEIEAEGVFVEIGLISNTGPVEGLLDLNDAGEVEVDCSCRTAVEGMFAAGDVTTVPFQQIVIAAGEGSKAALAAYDYLIQKQMV